VVRNPLHSHVLRILKSAQRFFALKITKINRHTATDTALVLAGVLPIDLVLFREHLVGSLFRLHSTVELDSRIFHPEEVEIRSSRWFLPPYCSGIFHNIILENPSPPSSCLEYYTDGSKTEEGVGVAFCVFAGGVSIFTWNCKIQSYNTVF